MIDFNKKLKEGVLMSVFSDRIRIILDSKGIQQKELAAQCGFSAARLNNYIVGRTEPSIDALYSICKALGITSDYLIGLSDSWIPAQIVSIAPEVLPRSPLDDLSPDRQKAVADFIEFQRAQQRAESAPSQQEA